MTPARLPFAALVLVGGLGTRLRQVVPDRPKPMALVRDVPFLEILMDSLAGKGIADFVLLTGHKSEMIEEYFLYRYKGRLNIRIWTEDLPLGTGGAVKNAEQFCTDPSLIVYGDSFFDADIDALFRLHFERQSHVTLSLYKVDDVSRYGAVELNDSCMITGFYEKNQGPKGPGMINAGFYLASKEFVRALPERRTFSMEKEVFPSYARSGKMFGLCQDRPFFDIGTPESYEAFKHFIEKR